MNWFADFLNFFSMCLLAALVVIGCVTFMNSAKANENSDVVAVPPSDISGKTL